MSGGGDLPPVSRRSYRKEVQGLRFNFRVPNVTTTWLAK